jgi:hypothetical protein
VYISFGAGGFASMGGGSTVQGRALVKVKVIDAATGDTLWPGRRDAAASRSRQPADGYRPHESRPTCATTLRRPRGRVVRLFHKFKPSEQGETMRQRLTGASSSRSVTERKVADHAATGRAAPRSPSSPGSCSACRSAAGDVVEEQVAALIRRVVDAGVVDGRFVASTRSSFCSSGIGIFAPHIVTNRLICATFEIGMMPAMIGTLMPCREQASRKRWKLGVVEEQLRDDRLRAGVDLGLEVLEVALAV